jgi:hypothetical protein
LSAFPRRYGKRGFFFKEWTTGHGWNRVKVTADECPRISGSFLDEERRTLGPHWFRQEYMCEFVETSHQLFGHDLIMGALDLGRNERERCRSSIGHQA